METILLIEDTVAILENLTEYLEMEGYTIIAANNGKKGIALAREFQPDLIVCDVIMYGMDGYEVLRTLQANPITSGIPFIFSTSMAEKIDRTDALKLGAAEYIVKPFALDDLLTKIKACVKAVDNKPGFARA